MKKILLVVLAVLVSCLLGIYIFIPSQFKITVHAMARCIPKNIAECLRDEASWKQWWPNSASRGNYKSFTYGRYQYKLMEPLTDGAEIQVNRNERDFKSRILVLPSGKDSSAVEWQVLLTSGYNPIQRVFQRFEARQIKNNIHNVLHALTNFADKTENMYGFHIKRTTFTDTILATTKFSSNSYPTTEAIYKNIEQLRKKIRQEGAQEKESPMLNVRQNDSNHFETMIAICINKEIRNSRNVFVSRMIPMKDRFLKTEVLGGPGSIRKAHNAIEVYMRDRFLSAPAIPFEILITDRSREPDTAKWKTTIFHPSM